MIFSISHIPIGGVQGHTQLHVDCRGPSTYVLYCNSEQSCQQKIKCVGFCFDGNSSRNKQSPLEAAP